jgi:hypothetical protein
MIGRREKGFSWNELFLVSVKVNGMPVGQVSVGSGKEFSERRDLSALTIVTETTVWTEDDRSHGLSLCSVAVKSLRKERTRHPRLHGVSFA